MPPRLSHRKSRKGCVRCKSRKVKCDEIRPKCGACIRHNVECEYEEFKRFVPNETRETVHQPQTRSSVTKEKQTAGTPASQSSRTTDLHGIGSQADTEEELFDPDTRRILELKLLHYFVYVVGPFLPSSESTETYGSWSCEGISLALEHSYLLNAILAMSALHIAVTNKRLRSGYNFASTTFADRVYAGFHSRGTFHKLFLGEALNTEGREKYLDIHQWYLDKALRDQQLALQLLDAQEGGSVEIDAVALTSILLSQLILGSENRSYGDGTTYAPPTRWLQISQSIHIVMWLAEKRLQPGDISVRIALTVDPNLRDDNVKLHPSFLTPFKSLLDFAPAGDVDHADSEAMEACRHALTYTGGVCAAVIRGEHPRQVCRRFMGFAPMVGRKYVDMIEQCRPRALVILAHLMANCKYIEHYWYCKDAAEREVYGIQSILPDQWQWAMEWPLKTLKELTDSPTSLKDANAE